MLLNCLTGRRASAATLSRLLSGAALLFLLAVSTQSMAQSSRPAYEGQWGSWDMIAGEWPTPQAFCDAELAYLKQTYGPSGTWFTYQGNGFQVPYSYAVYTYPDQGYLKYCDPRGSGGGGMAYGYTAFVGQVWLCPSGTTSATGQQGSWGTTAMLSGAPYQNLFYSERYLSTQQVYCSTSGTPRVTIVGKNSGQPQDTCTQSLLSGNPIHNGLATKLQTEVDSTIGPFNFTRTYNSSIETVAAMTVQGQLGGPSPGSRLWRSTYDRAVIIPTATSSAVLAVVLRPDGHSLEFVKNTTSGLWVPDADVNDQLVEQTSGGTRTGWKYVEGSTKTVETYDANGRLLTITTSDGRPQQLSYADGAGGVSPSGTPTCTLPSGVTPPSGNAAAGVLQCVTDSFGRQLNFWYDSQNRLSTLIDPNAGLTTYAYDEASSVVLAGQPLGGNLTSVTYPDGRKRTYYYNEQAYTASTNLPNALTGIAEEVVAGSSVRYGTYEYDAQGRAVSTQHAGGADAYSVSYTTQYVQSAVTDPLGTLRTQNFSLVLGSIKPTTVQQPAGAGSSACSDGKTYDTQGNITSRTEFTGSLRCYSYDTTRNLETARVEGFASGSTCPSNVATYTPAAGTAQRKIQTQWHPNWRLKSRIAEPNKITTFVYNGQPDPTNGNAIASCAPSTALVDGKPIAVLCKQVEQATTDTTGASGFSATATGSPRVTTFTYNSNGQVLTATGPRGNLVTTDPNYAAATTTLAYYAATDTGHTPPWYRAGDLQSLTDALSHVTQFTQYDGAGRPLTIVDANGQTTTLAYSARGWLTSRTVAGETTSFGYDGPGNLTTLTQPDSSVLTFTFDDAHRLTQITDSLNNTVVYTLDAMGNRTAEQTRDPSGTLKQSLSRAVDALNRVQQLVDAPSTSTASTWQFQFDANGNLTQTTDPRTQNTNQQFDALDRITQLLQPAPLTGGSRPQANFAYNGRDAITQITDPRSLATSYTVDGLGNLTQEVSPDRGTTVLTVDVAGNVLTSKDARNKTTTYKYDALNRLKQASYATGTATVYTYDQGTNGIGRLTGITDESGSTSFTYNAQGRVLTKTTTLGTGTGAKTRTMTYAYGTSGSANGHVVSVTYPSANRINTTYDAAGRITSLTLNPTNSNGVGTDTGTTVNLLSGITYQPFGPINGWTWGASGSGHTVSRTFDLNGRITSYPLGDPSQSGLVRTLTYDAANRITNYTHVNGSGVAQTVYDETFGYDNLDRLTSFVAGAMVGSYTLDLNSNRTGHTLSGTAYTDTIASTSNRLTAMSGPTESNTFDAAGNITSNGTFTFIYSDRGKLKTRRQVVGGVNQDVTYLYNGLEQRTTKSGSTSLVSTGTNYFVYDEAGHLIGEYDANVKVIEETVYLGATPVVVLTQTVSGSPAVTTTTVQNVYADHLNTPQVITRTSDHKMRWRWMPDPFGTTVPDENPQSLGAFTYNPRFPGQLFDKESNLFYNGYRYYDPIAGRYITVDPLGLFGGSWSPYAYVNGNPVTFVDPAGLMGNGRPLAGNPMPKKPPCENERCKNTITISHRGVCDGQEATCDAAMLAAGLQGPFRETSKRYDYICLLKFGVVGHTATGVGSYVATEKAPGIAAKLGASHGVLRYITGAAEFFNHPLVTTAFAGAGIAALLEECECPDAAP